VSGADAKCMADANYPGAGTYKALIVDGTNRVASVSANTGDGQVDWVLHPNTTYTRPDGTIIMTTNGNGIFVFGTLTNLFITTWKNPWDGIATGWTLTTGQTCVDWTSGAFADYGGIGNTSRNDGVAISATPTRCNGSNALYCVEQ